MGTIQPISSDKRLNLENACFLLYVAVVSGAVVERVTFGAYVIYAVCLLGFIYPMVVHWGWSSGGWASAFR